MKSVFLLQHSYELTPDTDEEVKIIGIYLTRSDADAAIIRLRMQPGFSDFPDHFVIDEYELGQDHWEEGFSTEYYTPIWDIWAKGVDGMMSRVEAGLTENEALQIVRDHELDGSSDYFAKERR